MSKENKAQASYTIEDLYSYAKSIGAEKLPLSLKYYCDDDWYNCEKEITERDLKANSNSLDILIVV